MKYQKNFILEYSCQLPIEGGAFYHADLIESSRPIYNEHFTKILLAYSIWLSETESNFTKDLPANQSKLSTNDDETWNNTDKETKLPVEYKDKVFFMLLGLGLEHLSNTTGLAQLSDETIADILEAIDYLLITEIARRLLVSRSVQLCVEILSILYK